MFRSDGDQPCCVAWTLQGISKLAGSPACSNSRLEIFNLRLPCLCKGIYKDHTRGGPGTQAGQNRPYQEVLRIWWTRKVKAGDLGYIPPLGNRPEQMLSPAR